MRQVVEGSRGFVLTGDDERYSNYADASMRLGKTVIRFKDVPYYVDLVDGNGTILLTPIGKIGHPYNHLAVDMNDSRLDISSIPLGYVNTKEATYYVERMSVRTQKQGVCLRNCAVVDVATGRHSNRYDQVAVLNALDQPINRIYPSPDEVLSGKTTGGAFSRTWAVGSRKDSKFKLLYHRSNCVGWYNPKKKAFVFSEGDGTNFRKNSLKNILNKTAGEHYAVV